MNVWNKVLMVLTGLLCVAFTIFAANKYQLTKDNEQKLAKLQQEIADTLDANEKLRYEIYGDPAKTVESWSDCGLDGQLSYLRNLVNGEVFTNCEAIEARVDDTAMTSTVAFGVDPQYNMSSFRSGAIVYLFDSGSAFVKKAAPVGEGEETAVAEPSDESDASAGAAAPYVFLGAFKIKDSAASQVNLVSVGEASEAELAALQASSKSGNSFVAGVDRLPVDSPADLAKFAAETPELFSAFDADLTAFLSKNTADAAALGAALAEDGAASIANFEKLFGTDLRVPVAYQDKIERQWATRDAGNVLKASNLLALDELNYVVGDQAVSMGDKAIAGHEDAFDKIQAAFGEIEGWSEVFAAAQDRKKVESYAERIDEANAKLAKMNGYNKILEDIIAEAEQNNKDCQKAIDELIAKNAELASNIARAQYAAAEKFQNDSATASVGANSFVGI